MPMFDKDGQRIPLDAGSISITNQLRRCGRGHSWYANDAISFTIAVQKGKDPKEGFETLSSGELCPWCLVNQAKELYGGVVIVDEAVEAAPNG